MCSHTELALSLSRSLSVAPPPGCLCLPSSGRKSLQASLFLAVGIDSTCCIHHPIFCINSAAHSGFTPKSDQFSSGSSLRFLPNVCRCCGAEKTLRYNHFDRAEMRSFTTVKVNSVMTSSQLSSSDHQSKINCAEISQRGVLPPSFVLY